MRRKPLARELAGLADRQHGVVSVRQLVGELGHSRSQVARALRAGHLHRVHRGVFAVGHTSLTWRGRCLAAVLASGTEALLSHGSAAWLWGLSRRGPAPLEVTVGTPRAPRDSIVVHQARGLVEADRAIRDGIPVTSVARALLDNAAIVRSDVLRRQIERAEELELFDLREVEASMGRARGHRGIGSLGRELAIYKAPPFSRSQFERRFVRAVERAGLPRPRTGFNVAGFELDVYWPEHRFAVELDSFATHGTHAAFERDRQRQEDLLLHGIGMTRVTDVRFAREPKAVVERVARLLAQWRRR